MYDTFFISQQHDKKQNLASQKYNNNKVIDLLYKISTQQKCRLFKF
jgi:hypothetical protein